VVIVDLAPFNVVAGLIGSCDCFEQLPVNIEGRTGNKNPFPKTSNYFKLILTRLGRYDVPYVLDLQLTQ
jgi:hypothetical protein